MFASIALSDGRVARFEMGRPVDPKLAARPHLERMLADYDWRQDELWDVPTHLCWRALVEILQQAQSDVPLVCNTLDAIGRHTWDEAAAAVEPFMKHGDRRVLAGAIEALGRMGRFSSIKLIGDYLLPEQPLELRQVATRALGKFGIPIIAVGLKQAAGDDPELMRLATEAEARLSAQGEGSSRGMVDAVIGTGEWEDLAGWIGLCRRHLTEVAQSPRYDDETRARAAALGAIRGSRKTGALGVRFLRDETLALHTRRQLVVGMGRSRTRAAVPALIEFLEHDDRRMREAAVIALGRIGDVRGQLALAARWDAQQGELRPLIRLALCRLSRLSGSELLDEALAVEERLEVTTAVFISDDDVLAAQLPREWVEQELASAEPQARLEAVLLLAHFGDATDIITLTALLEREQDSRVYEAAQRGLERLVAYAGEAAPPFEPWPA